MTTSIRLNNTALVVLGIVGAALATAFTFSGLARAEETSRITFPVSELGSCADRVACKAYCADTTNRSACLAFARSHSLKVATSTDDGVKLKALKLNGGPGNCAKGATDPKAACKAYCDSTEHMDECVAYGRSHNLFAGERLEHAVKAQMALSRSTTTPFIKAPADFKLYLSYAPEVVKKCVGSAVGQKALDSVVSGATIPDTTLGAKIKACFEQNRPIKPNTNASTTREGSGERMMGKPLRLPPSRTESASSTSFGNFLMHRFSGLASAFGALLP